MRSNVPLESVTEIQLINKVTNKQEVRLNKMKGRIALILQNSAAPGIPNILRINREVVKAIWIAFYIVSLSACVYYIFKSFADCFQYSTVTTIKVIREEQPQFPTISF